ncbi:MAG: hypothetical protein JXR96_21910, partial [Deltaproteobacteria bacterium]|nr:hypothetical protein [Deltaproteobacteria bacterium]
DPGTGCVWACVDGSCTPDCEPECETAADCEDLPWNLQCPGHWECQAGQCVAVCDTVECTDVSDCLGLTPPVDCEGHWECSHNECVWICDSVDCETPEDCEGLPWPIRCLGHWECNAGACEAVCDNIDCEVPADCDSMRLPCEDGGEWLCENGLCIPWCYTRCETASDCLDEPWLVYCVGHWGCERGQCVEVCDYENCGDGECDPVLGESAQSCAVDCLEECRVPEDCENLPWPIDCLGHWECRDGACVPVCDSQPECFDARDCADHFWNVRCYGHWACEHGQCEEVCDYENCGDGECDLALGETPESCPLDCAAACQDPSDCEDLPWPIYCIGHWECREGQCVAVCDDVPECAEPLDCLEREWMVDCVGHWGCEQGRCVEVCEDRTCGDGICDPVGGESVGSCFIDCETECRAPIDCIDHEWLIFCQGHWECMGGTCSPICEFDTCGDGVCNPEGGESEWSCGVDCSRQCEAPADCLGLPWDVDCVGHWDCVRGQCTEVCDFETCGDGTCDRLGGESPQSCPDDCAVCVEEGMPTGIPPACCDGLDALSDCVPDEPCPGSLLFCVDCGNRSCDPHENPYNCLDDCMQGCPVGDRRLYSCPDGSTVPWCSCEGPDCWPICLYPGTDSEGWYDSCSGRLIDYASCGEGSGRVHEAVCLYFGSESEGWYDSATEEIIMWDYCAPLWNCLIDPKVNCR